MNDLLDKDTSAADLPDNDSNTELPNELTLLKERATLMGIHFHPSIGIASLSAKINAALTDASMTAKFNAALADTTPAAPTARTINTGEETPAMRNQRLRKEATKLIRVNITCMNPNKKDWPGEIISLGNSVVGMIKKYVPFNISGGYHLPYIIYTHLKDRQCQVFYTVVLPNGQKTQRGKLINEFAIEVLPNLTPDEITELARTQAINNSIE